MKITDIKAIGNYVVLEAIPIQEKKETKTKAGIIIPGKEEEYGTNINNATNTGKVKSKLVVKSIGSDVDKTKYDLKIGDEVYADNYDLQTIGDSEGHIYSLVKITSIKCVIKSEE